MEHSLSQIPGQNYNNALIAGGWFGLFASVTGFYLSVAALMTKVSRRYHLSDETLLMRVITPARGIC